MHYLMALQARSNSAVLELPWPARRPLAKTKAGFVGNLQPNKDPEITMDAKNSWIKAKRYLVTVPPDALLCAVFWMTLAVLSPTQLFAGSLRKCGGWRLDLIAGLLILGLGKWPSTARRKSLLGTFVRAGVPVRKWPLTLCALPEKYERRWLGFFTPELHHLARVQVVKTRLPRAARILDLGGSCGGIPEGALLHMGYPHVPEEVVIVDLPPEQQFETYRKHTNARPVPLEYVHANKTRVRTVYTRMDDLSGLQTGSFDLVWSGQSLEHVTRDQAKAVLREVARVLKPDGVFCFDTPNREISRLLTRTGMLHPDHKIEYTSSELEQLLAESGFKAKRVLGETIMPTSLLIGRFCRCEALHADLLSDNAREGFSIFMECIPAASPG